MSSIQMLVSDSFWPWITHHISESMFLCPAKWVELLILQTVTHLTCGNFFSIEINCSLLLPLFLLGYLSLSYWFSGYLNIFQLQSIVSYLLQIMSPSLLYLFFWMRKIDLWQFYFFLLQILCFLFHYSCPIILVVQCGTTVVITGDVWDSQSEEESFKFYR